MNGIKCCYKCQERYLGCHASCETYLAEKEVYDNERREMLQKKQLSYNLSGMSIARNNKSRKAL